MAIETLWADGFDSYQTNTISRLTEYDRWESAGSGCDILIGTGRNSGNALQGYASTGDYVKANAGAERRLFIMGFAYKTESSLDDAFVAAFYATDATTGGNFVHSYADFVLRETSDGKLAAYTNANTTLLDTGTTVLERNTWYYIEMRAYRHATAGSWDVTINGTSEISGTAEDLVNQGSSLYWYRFGFGEAIVDDVYVRGDDADTAGGYFGDVSILSKMPNANGTNRDFTRSTGTDDFALVDENPPSASDYLYSSTAAHQVSMGFEDVGASVTVKSAVLYVLSETDPVGGSRDYKPLCRSASTDYTGTAVAIPDQSYRIHPYDEDPATSSAWTATNLNAAEFGVELQAV